MIDPAKPTYFIGKLAPQSDHSLSLVLFGMAAKTDIVLDDQQLLVSRAIITMDIKDGLVFIDLVVHNPKDNKEDRVRAIIDPRSPAFSMRGVLTIIKVAEV